MRKVSYLINVFSSVALCYVVCAIDVEEIVLNLESCSNFLCEFRETLLDCEIEFKRDASHSREYSKEHSCLVHDHL